MIAERVGDSIRKKTKDEKSIESETESMASECVIVEYESGVAARRVAVPVRESPLYARGQRERKARK